MVALALGARHACALDPDGALACWFLAPRADDDASLVTPPAGHFVAIDAQGEHTCALDTEGQISCWGDGGAEGAVPTAGEPFVSVAVGDTFACGLTASEELRCVGDVPPSNEAYWAAEW